LELNSELLGISVAILIGVLGTACCLAVRNRSLLTGSLVVLLSLMVVQAVAIKVRSTWEIPMPIWLERIGEAEIAIVLSAALGLLAIAVLARAFERQGKSEQELFEQSAALQSAQQIAGLEYYIYDDDIQANVFCSLAFAEIYGLSQDDLLSSWHEKQGFVHPDDQEAVARIYSEAAANRSSYALDFRLIRPDGEVCFVREAGVYADGSKGKTARSVGTLLDVTESREVERQAREYASILANAQRIAGIGAYVFDDQLDEMVYVSPEYAAIHGQGQDDLLGSLVVSLDQIDPSDRDQVIAEHRASMENAAPYDMEYRIVRPDGEARFVREVGEVLPAKDGEPPRTIGTVLDLTDVRHTERDLAEQQEVLAFAQRVGPIGHIVYDAELGRAIAVSQAAADICGTTQEEMLVSWEEDLATIHPGDRKRVRQAYAAADRGEEIDIEYRLLHPQGIRHIHEVNLRLDDGVRSLSTLQDITARKTIEEELRRATNEAEIANEAKSRFLATMSHELRTPMNGVLDIADLLSDSGLDRQHMRYVNNLRQSGEALLTIINDVLDLSKIEAGKLELEHAPFEIDDVVTAVADLLYPVASEKQLVLGAIIAPDIPQRMVGDAGRLCQILVNLVGNALKFTDSGGVIIRVSLDDPLNGEARLRFSVTDTGVGIPEGASNRLFEMFSQVDPSSGRTRGGTGLGLAISRRLVGLMKGEIGFTSAFGKGSEFHFTARFGVGEPKKGDTAASRLDGDVLVIDATVVGRELLAGQITDAGGCAVIVAPDEVVPAGYQWKGAVIGHLADHTDPVEQVRTLHGLPEFADVRVVAVAPVGSRVSSADGADAFVPVPVHQRDLIAALSGEELSRSDRQSGGEGDNPHAARGGIRILLAEDNRVNQLVTVKLLEHAGYIVEVASNGIEALEALRHRPFDLVLMDSSMPEMGGVEAARQIRRFDDHRAVVPIIALTADALPGDRERYLEAGMSDYLPKPVRRPDLLSMVASWVDGVAPASKTDQGNAAR
jgi:PAS domain S-box-containing protein